MPLFEDPANFSKSRLKSDLLAHNVSLPPAKSKKEVYLHLHLKHIGRKNAADFSSEEEDQVKQDMPVSWVVTLRIGEREKHVLFNFFFFFWREEGKLMFQVY